VISGGYELRRGILAGFHVGRYDRKRPLVIDPVLMYSTYLGGSKAENSTGISSDDRKSAMTVDAAGNAYITGNTESTDFFGANRG
jgi:beta-propeller repeat-containing protein